MPLRRHPIFEVQATQDKVVAPGAPFGRRDETRCSRKAGVRVSAAVGALLPKKRRACLTLG